jgi:hypothetical protein
MAEYQESSGDKKRPTCRADNLAAIYESNIWKNMGASTSPNPKGLHGLYRDNFTFTLDSTSKFGTRGSYEIGNSTGG